MDESMDNDILEPLVKAYLSQMDSALKVSDVLAQHSNSDEIHTDHLIGGLVYRLMVPMTNEEVTESLNSAEQIMNHLDETDSDEEDTLNYDEVPETYPNPGEPEYRKIRAPLCNCDICSQLRVCLLNYNSYIPDNQLTQKFKDSIDSTCHKYKLYI